MCDHGENAIEKGVEAWGQKGVNEPQGLLMKTRCIVDKGMKKANPYWHPRYLLSAYGNSDMVRLWSYGH